MSATSAVSREEKRVENKDVRILIVDDEAMMADSLRQHLSDEGYSVDTAATGAEGIERFDQGGHHLAICDLQLPDMDGLEVMRHMKDARPTTEVIVVTGYGSVQRAVDATKAGAFYFVEKPFDFEELQPLVDKALERRELVAEAVSMRRQLSTRSEYFNIIGSSKQMQTIYETIESVAKSDANVLIVGESGTGKELIANAIHYNSLRSKKTFIKVNCAALPPSLIPSELFGHEKGAFTGAMQRRLGRFELADGGTIFLDEVGELLPDTQVVLLRVLQEREFERVGGGRPIRVDVRVIAATNRDLKTAVTNGTFRADLFYRLNVFPVEVPPLRERKDDIPLLVRHFTQQFARRMNKVIDTISSATMDALRQYHWPGNIRELQNVIERSVILCETEILSIDESWLPQQPFLTEPTNQIEFSRRLQAEEMDIIEAALKESGGRVFGPSGAAVKLGIARSTLESKIRSLKIDKNHFKPSPAT